MNLRKIEENVVKVLMVLATLVVVGSLALILIAIIAKGLPGLNLDMITKTPQGGYYLGKEGGILNAILGSLYIAGGATILSIVISLPVALYLNIYAKKNSFMIHFTRFSLDVLWGIPSIVYGAFGLTIMLFFGMRASLLAGIITVSFLELPIMARAMDEVIRMVPQELKDASYCLGANKYETALKVIVRQTLPALLTAVLIAFGRGIGDAASVLFTAGFTDSIPDSFLRPAATLPLAIFFQLGSPIPEVQDRAYAAALILTIIILLISILTRILTKKFMKNSV
jgi:phosphate transport system permease protein